MQPLVTVAANPSPKALNTMPAPQHDPKPVDYLSKLPTELLILIAQFYLHPSENHFPFILHLTRVNSRLRQVIIGTPNLWTSFMMSEAISSPGLVRLCIERSLSLPLEIQLYAFNLSRRSGLCDHYCDVLRPAAPRIRVLITYMATYGGLNVVRGVLEKLEMPMLEEVNLEYDSLFNYGPNRTIRIPGGGTNLRTLTLTGLVPINSNLSNLKSLTLGSGRRWQWSTSSISALVKESTSLENLTFVGGESTFDVEDDSAGFVLLSPSLRYLGMKGGISANSATRFLLALHAPNLETVHVTTPSVRYKTMVPVDWKEVMGRLGEKYVEGNWTIENVRSLVIDPEDERYSPRHNEDFFRFLKNAFPYITSLDLDVAEIEVLRFCKEENDVFDGDWAHLNKLTLRGNPSPRALKRLLDFVRSRNRGKHEASGVVGAGVDEDAGSSWLIPIETVVIKWRKVADAASGELLRLLGEEVQVVEIA